MKSIVKDVILLVICLACIVAIILWNNKKEAYEMPNTYCFVGIIEINNENIYCYETENDPKCMKPILDTDNYGCYITSFNDYPIILVEDNINTMYLKTGDTVTIMIPSLTGGSVPIDYVVANKNINTEFIIQSRDSNSKETTYFYMEEK